MIINAAILWEQGQPLSVEETELDTPRAGEVLVEVKAAGVCHSDLHPARGDWSMKTPLVLGHEGTGIVREIGPGVSELKVGDHVVFCWAPACGTCAFCISGRPVLCDRLPKTTYRNRLPAGGTRLRARNKDVDHFNGTACFADFAVVAEEGAIPVPADVPFEVLATIGCAVVTGVGAVTNAAQAKSGDSVLIIGAGGVGLNVAQGARLAGCDPIIAVDLRQSALNLAQEFGASHLIDGSKEKAVEAILDLTGGRGLDFVFDTVGTPNTLTQALQCTRKGGTTVLTGLSRTDALGSVATFPFVLLEKRLIGSLYGSGSPASDIPHLVTLYKEGKLKLRELVTRSYQLEEVNTALAELAAGTDARGVIQWQ